MKTITPFQILLFTLTFSLYSMENVAVLELDADGVTPSEARTLTNKLRSELFKTGRFAVIERNEMDNILQEQGFQSTGCTSQECVIEVGQLLGVRGMVAGSIGKVGSIYLVSLRLIDVAKGNLVKAADEEIEGDLAAVLRTGIGNAARKLADISVEVSAGSVKPSEVVAQPVLDSLNSRKLFTIAIGRSSLEAGNFSLNEKFAFNNSYSGIKWENGPHIRLSFSPKNIYTDKEGSSKMISVADIGLFYERNSSTSAIVQRTDSIGGTIDSIPIDNGAFVLSKITMFDNVCIGYLFDATGVGFEPYIGVGFACDFAIVSGSLINRTLNKLTPRITMPLGIRFFLGKLFVSFEYCKTVKSFRTATDPDYNNETGQLINGDLSFENGSYWAVGFGACVGK